MRETEEVAGESKRRGAWAHTHPMGHLPHSCPGTRTLGARFSSPGLERWDLLSNSSFSGEETEAGPGLFSQIGAWKNHFL